MNNLDDTELIKLITTKDETALGELYDRYHRLIFSIAVKIVNNREEAEEITLDVFTKVWEKAHTYRHDQAKVYTWLVRLTRNRSIDILRRESVRPMKGSLSWFELSPEPMANNLLPEAAVGLEFQKRRVRKAIVSLSPEQQEVLALAYFGGYSHSQIAGKLNLPLGTVKTRIRSAMQRLRGIFENE